MAVHAPESPPRPKVLLVGTGPAEGAYIADMLRATCAHELLLADSSQLGEAVPELLAAPASCILLDLSRLPGDPVAMVAKLGSTAPAVPIVVLANHADDAQALSAVRAGAQDYLIKSEVYPSLLCRAINYAIERKRAEVKLAHRAMHDPLTGLPNRVLLLDRLGLALDRARRAHTEVAVLFLDVDNFKEINDSLGHAAGDRVLVGLADRLRALLRPMDTVARFGGDEFTFLVEDLSDEGEVVPIADRINRAASRPISLDGERVSISVSIGIAMVSGQSVEPPEMLIREADAAMYRAKHQGRGGYELFDERSRHRTLSSNP